MYLIGILGSKLVLSNNQSRATLWVLDTCLIVGLLPLIIILITSELFPLFSPRVVLCLMTKKRTSSISWNSEWRSLHLPTKFLTGVRQFLFASTICMPKLHIFKKLLALNCHAAFSRRFAQLFCVFYMWFETWTTWFRPVLARLCLLCFALYAKIDMVKFCFPCIRLRVRSCSLPKTRLTTETLSSYSRSNTCGSILNKASPPGVVDRHHFDESIGWPRAVGKHFQNFACDSHINPVLRKCHIKIEHWIMMRSLFHSVR